MGSCSCLSRGQPPVPKPLIYIYIPYVFIFKGERKRGGKGRLGTYRDRRRKVPMILEHLQPKQRLELLDRLCLVPRHEQIKVIHDPIDPGHTVLGRVLLYRGVPLRVSDIDADRRRGRDAAVEDVAVDLDRERRLRAGEAAAVQDPGRPRCRQVALDVREHRVLRKVRVVRYGLVGGEKQQLVRGARVERVRLPVVPVLEDDAEAVGRLHQDLDNPRLQVGEPAGPAGLAGYVQVYRTACRKSLAII